MGLRKRILVVDDEERVLFVLSEGLAMLGKEYEIVTAGGSREALDKITQAAFDLVITDLRMPDIDGLQLTEAIKALNPVTIVLWITAYDCYKLRGEAERLGVYRCLDKPLEIKEIRETVREALGEGRGKAAAGSGQLSSKD